MLTKDKFLALASSRYDELKDIKMDNLYDLEVEFAKLWRELGQQVFQQKIGTSPADRRKKNDKNDVR